MAEDVYIEGFAAGGDFPDFATEATLKGILRATEKQDPTFKKMVALLASVAAGEKISASELKKIQSELQKQRSDDKKKTKKEDELLKSSKDANKESTKQTNVFSKLLLLGKERNDIALKSLKEDIKNDKRMQELLKEGFSSESAGLLSKMEGMSAALGKIAGPLATAIGHPTAVVGVNAYMKQQAQDRFNFAQELRQSGLAAGLESSQASLTSFAETVRRNNFTLGEAAEFTQRFANAVGVIGVRESMAFVNSLAYAGEGGGDMMRRFGMEFGEVANVAGTYLDSVRSLGMLDRMSQEQMRTGMDDFMSTVVSTSNVMKINMEDAAQMIKETLARDDITSLLATMDPEQAQQVQEVVGQAGGMNNAMGEALAMRLASRSEQSFMMTDSYASLIADPISASILPIVEKLAQATERGGVSEFQSEFANLETDINAFMNLAESQRSILVVGEQNAQELVASLSRIRETIADADDGFVDMKDLGDDQAVVGSIEASRQFAVALEGVNNAFIENADLETNLTKLNTANITLAGEIEKTGVAIAQHADILTGTTTSAQSIVTNLASGVVNVFGDITTSISENSAKSLENVIAMRRAVEETFGATSLEVMSAPIIEQYNKLQDIMLASTEGDTEYERRVDDFERLDISNNRRELFNLINELAETRPETAAAMIKEMNLSEFATEGQTLQYDPEQLKNQTIVETFQPGVVTDEIKNRDGEYMLQGGGTMESRDSALRRITGELAAMEEFNSLGRSYVNDAVQALNSGDTSRLLDMMGFDDGNDRTVAQMENDQAFIAEMIKIFDENKLIQKETFDELIKAMQEDRGRGSFGFDNTRQSVSERTELQQLTAVLTRLVGELRN